MLRVWARRDRYHGRRSGIWGGAVIDRDRPKEVAMAQETLTRLDQACISECIFKHWSENSTTPSESRQEAYEKCLENCQVCM